MKEERSHIKRDQDHEERDRKAKEGTGGEAIAILTGHHHILREKEVGEREEKENMVIIRVRAEAGVEVTGEAEETKEKVGRVWREIRRIVGQCIRAKNRREAEIKTELEADIERKEKNKNKQKPRRL